MDKNGINESMFLLAGIEELDMSKTEAESFSSSTSFW
jgi:hypothetical protein